MRAQSKLVMQRTRLCIFVVSFLTLCQQTLEGSPCDVSNACHGNGTCIVDASQQQGYHCNCDQNGHFSSNTPVNMITNVVLPWKGQYCRANLALNKLAKQSSTNYDKPSDAINAIDILKTSGDINNHGCSLTKKMDDPWLMVDLDKGYKVRQVILKRADCCPAIVQLTIGNSSTARGIDNSRCGDLTVLSKGVYVPIYCNPPRHGRYLFVRYPGRMKELSICGLEVYSDFTDFDECTSKYGVCADEDRMLCINTLGSFRCECEQGNSLDKELGTCVDKDECKLGVHKCNKNAHCENRVPGYQCLCNKGYHGDGFMCNDVNECKTKEIDCGSDHRAHCINTIGSYNCSCSIGFQFNPLKKNCEDVDECKNGNELCSASTCMNTYGSYTCAACADGYWKQGWMCQDFDECKYGKYSCPENEACKNTVGSYQCVCKAGYKRHGKSCQDINECKTITCSKNTECINTLGSFKCVCKQGYREVKNVCLSVQGHHSGRSNRLRATFPSLVSMVIVIITMVIL